MSKKYKIDERTYLFINNDLSGGAIFRNGENGTEHIADIKAETLLSIVADFVMGEKISRLEQESPEEILGL